MLRMRLTGNAMATVSYSYGEFRQNSMLMQKKSAFLQRRGVFEITVLRNGLNAVKLHALSNSILFEYLPRGVKRRSARISRNSFGRF